ncbi:MAG: hypothetical protein ACF8NJ_09390 [Phycisphaerales bacterium JB038]
MNRLIHTLTASCLLLTLAATALAQGGNKFPFLEDEQPATPELDLPPVGLAIQALQQTPGGPAIASVRAIVQLHEPTRGAILETIETQLDEHGVILLEELPLDTPFIPVVQVEYAGVTYSAVGETMNLQAPQQKLVVPCYEVTEDVPDWRVGMRHVQAMPVEGGFQVQELLVLMNPADRTWLGLPAGGEDRNTTSFNIPESAANVELGQGFHGWCCTVKLGGTIINQLPLMPGQTQMRVAYFLPAEEGGARVNISCPAPTASLMVMVPPSVGTSEVDGLQPMGMQSMGEASMNMFVQENLAPGQSASLLLAATSAPTDIAQEAQSQNMAKMIGIIGGAIVLLAGIVFILMKPKSSAP